VPVCRRPGESAPARQRATSEPLGVSLCSASAPSQADFLSILSMIDLGWGGRDRTSEWRNQNQARYEEILTAILNFAQFLPPIRSIGYKPIQNEVKGVTWEKQAYREPAPTPARPLHRDLHGHLLSGGNNLFSEPMTAASPRWNQFSRNRCQIFGFPAPKNLLYQGTRDQRFTSAIMCSYVSSLTVGLLAVTEALKTRPLSMYSST